MKNSSSATGSRRHFRPPVRQKELISSSFAAANLQLFLLFHVGLDLQLFNESLNHGPALAAALFKVLLQTLVLRPAETHLNISGSQRTRRYKLVVLRTLDSKDLRNQCFRKEDPFAFLVLNFARKSPRLSLQELQVASSAKQLLLCRLSWFLWIYCLLCTHADHASPLQGRCSRAFCRRARVL